MCQACLRMASLELPPWLLEPGLTWSKRKQLQLAQCKHECPFAIQTGNQNASASNPGQWHHGNIQTSISLPGSHHGLSHKFAMSNSKKFIEEIVKAHNEYREKHQAPPLRHSPELTSEAQRWADHLATTNTFQHSNAKIGSEKLGENIAMKWSSKPDSYTGQEVTDQWYSEVKMHKFGGEPRVLNSGHFSQVVWKGSREIGIGRSQTSDGKILIVANYRPAGNVIGSYSQNVLPPNDGKIVTSRKVVGLESSKTNSKEKPNLVSSQNRAGRMSRLAESRSTRTYTTTEGSGPNAVTKTVVEETIIKADGSKVTNKTETVTRGAAGGPSSSLDKKSGFGGDGMPDINSLKLEGNDSFFRSKEKSDDSSPDTKRKPQKLSEFIEDCVKAHNTSRKKHGVPSVKHAKDLSDYAQKWAEKLASTNSFQHSSCVLNGTQLGENIACKWSSGGGDYTGEEVTEQWYSEIKKHDFSGEPRSTGTGHFTQVVWKGTKEVGFGKAVASGGKVYVVGSYRPAGNLIGSYMENVPPPKK